MTSALRLTLLFALVAPGACKRSADVDASDVKTDLGSVGNDDVTAKANAYKDHTQCTTTGTGRRVIVTGFGPFIESSDATNISGLVASAMGRSDFFPDTLPTTAPDQVPTPTMAGTTGGSIALNRTFIINQHRYEVCYLVLDVRWDLAGAIIVYELEAFNPEMIIMSGLDPNGGDHGTVEAAAVNQASYSYGYDGNGARVTHSRPAAQTGATVLPASDAGVMAQIPMSWDQTALKGAADRFAKTIKSTYAIDAAPDARDGNDYICNNTSFIVLHAIKGVKLNLAGGALTISPTEHATESGASIPAGFFHYPATSQNSGASDVFGWGGVVGAMIDAQLGPTTTAEPASGAAVVSDAAASDGG